MLKKKVELLIIELILQHTNVNFPPNLVLMASFCQLCDTNLYNMTKPDCMNLMPTYLHTGHLSHHSHSLDIFCGTHFATDNYYKSFL